MASLTLVNIGAGDGLVSDDTKPLPEPLLTYCQLDSKEHILMKFCLKFISFHSRKYMVENVICKIFIFALASIIDDLKFFKWTMRSNNLSWYFQI